MSLDRALPDLRVYAAGAWNAAVSARNDQLGGPSVLPGNFVDRFAFAGYLDGPAAIVASIDAHLARWPLSNEEYGRRLEDVWIPAVSLGGWVPRAEDLITSTEFGQWLHQEWKSFVGALGLSWPMPTPIPVAGRTWLELAKDSDFYPLTPAIPGANYFDMLADVDRNWIIDEYGPAAPIEFFAFMLSVHETIHRAQRGEPVFNEIVQAAVWTSFVESAGLESFQVNSESGRSCTLEIMEVRANPWILERFKESPDSRDLIGSELGPAAYEVLCAWAAAFDSGRLRYSPYLRGAGVLVRELRKVPERWIPQSDQRWDLTRLAADVMTLVR